MSTWDVLDIAEFADESLDRYLDDSLLSVQSSLPSPDDSLQTESPPSSADAAPSANFSPPRPTSRAQPDGAAADVSASKESDFHSVLEFWRQHSDASRKHAASPDNFSPPLPITSQVQPDRAAVDLLSASLDASAASPDTSLEAALDLLSASLDASAFSPDTSVEEVSVPSASDTTTFTLPSTSYSNESSAPSIAPPARFPPRPTTPGIPNRAAPSSVLKGARKSPFSEKDRSGRSGRKRVTFSPSGVKQPPSKRPSDIADIDLGLIDDMARSLSGYIATATSTKNITKRLQELYILPDYRYDSDDYSDDDDDDLDLSNADWAKADDSSINLDESSNVILDDSTVSSSTGVGRMAVAATAREGMEESISSTSSKSNAPSVSKKRRSRDTKTKSDKGKRKKSSTSTSRRSTPDADFVAELLMPNVISCGSIRYTKDVDDSVRIKGDNGELRKSARTIPLFDSDDDDSEGSKRPRKKAAAAASVKTKKKKSRISSTKKKSSSSSKGKTRIPSSKSKTKSAKKKAGSSTKPRSDTRRSLSSVNTSSTTTSSSSSDKDGDFLSVLLRDAVKDITGTVESIPNIEPKDITGTVKNIPDLPLEDIAGAVEDLHNISLDQELRNIQLEELTNALLGPPTVPDRDDDDPFFRALAEDEPEEKTPAIELLYPQEDQLEWGPSGTIEILRAGSEDNGLDVEVEAANKNRGGGSNRKFKKLGRRVLHVVKTSRAANRGGGNEGGAGRSFVFRPRGAKNRHNSVAKTPKICDQRVSDDDESDEAGDAQPARITVTRICKDIGLDTSLDMSLDTPIRVNYKNSPPRALPPAQQEDVSPYTQLDLNESASDSIVPQITSSGDIETIHQSLFGAHGALGGSVTLADDVQKHMSEGEPEEEEACKPDATNKGRRWGKKTPFGLAEIMAATTVSKKGKRQQRKKDQEVDENHESNEGDVDLSQEATIATSRAQLIDQVSVLIDEIYGDKLSKAMSRRRAEMLIAKSGGNEKKLVASLEKKVKAKRDRREKKVKAKSEHREEKIKAKSDRREEKARNNEVLHLSTCSGFIEDDQTALSVFGKEVDIDSFVTFEEEEADEMLTESKGSEIAEAASDKGLIDLDLFGKMAEADILEMMMASAKDDESNAKNEIDNSFDFLPNTRDLSISRDRTSLSAFGEEVDMDTFFKMAEANVLKTTASAKEYESNTENEMASSFDYQPINNAHDLSISRDRTSLSAEGELDLSQEVTTVDKSRAQLIDQVSELIDEIYGDKLSKATSRRSRAEMIIAEFEGREKELLTSLEKKIKARRDRQEEKAQKAATVEGEARKTPLLDLTTCTDATEDMSSPEPSPSKSVHIENFLDLSVNEEEIGEEVELGTVLMRRAADELAAPHSSSQDTPTNRTADIASQPNLKDGAVESNATNEIFGSFYPQPYAHDRSFSRDRTDLSAEGDIDTSQEVTTATSRAQLIDQVSELIDEIYGDNLGKATSRLRAEMLIAKSGGNEKKLVASLEKKVKAKRDRREEKVKAKRDRRDEKIKAKSERREEKIKVKSDRREEKIKAKSDRREEKARSNEVLHLSTSSGFIEDDQTALSAIGEEVGFDSFMKFTEDGKIVAETKVSEVAETTDEKEIIDLDDSSKMAEADILKVMAASAETNTENEIGTSFDSLPNTRDLSISRDRTSLSAFGEEVDINTFFKVAETNVLKTMASAKEHVSNTENEMANSFDSQPNAHDRSISRDRTSLSAEVESNDKNEIATSFDSQPNAHDRSISRQRTDISGEGEIDLSREVTTAASRAQLIDQVSVLIDEIYGDNASKATSRRRAETIIAKSEGNEKKLLASLEETVKAKRDRRENNARRNEVMHLSTCADPTEDITPPKPSSEEGEIDLLPEVTTNESRAQLIDLVSELIDEIYGDNLGKATSRLRAEMLIAKSGGNEKKLVASLEKKVKAKRDRREEKVKAKRDRRDEKIKAKSERREEKIKAKSDRREEKIKAKSDRREEKARSNEVLHLSTCPGFIEDDQTALSVFGKEVGLDSFMKYTGDGKIVAETKVSEVAEAASDKGLIDLDLFGKMAEADILEMMMASAKDDESNAKNEIGTSFDSLPNTRDLGISRDRTSLSAFGEEVDINTFFKVAEANVLKTRASFKEYESNTENEMANSFVSQPNAHDLSISRDRTSLSAEDESNDKNEIVTSFDSQPNAHNHSKPSLSAEVESNDKNEIVTSFGSQPNAHDRSRTSLSAEVESNNKNEIVTSFGSQPNAHDRSISRHRTVISGEGEIDFSPEFTTAASRAQLIDQVSVLVDEIYGDNVSKATSRLRAEMLIAKAKGNEKKMVASLENKVKAKRDRREAKAQKNRAQLIDQVSVLIDEIYGDNLSKATSRRRAEMIIAKSEGNEKKLVASLEKKAKAKRDRREAKAQKNRAQLIDQVSVLIDEIYGDNLSKATSRRRAEMLIAKAQGNEKKLVASLEKKAKAKRDRREARARKNRAQLIDQVSVLIDEIYGDNLSKATSRRRAEMLIAKAQGNEKKLVASLEKKAKAKRDRREARARKNRAQLIDQVSVLIDEIYGDNLSKATSRRRAEMLIAKAQGNEKKLVASLEKKAKAKRDRREARARKNRAQLIDQVSVLIDEIYGDNLSKATSRRRAEMLIAKAQGNEKKLVASLEKKVKAKRDRREENARNNEVLHLTTCTDATEEMSSPEPSPPKAVVTVTVNGSQPNARDLSISRDQTSLSAVGEEIDIDTFFMMAEADGGAVDAEESNNDGNDDDLSACYSGEGVELFVEFNDTDDGDIAIPSPSLGDETFLKELSFHLEVYVLLNAIYGLAPTDEYAERRAKALFERYQGQEDILIAALRLQAEDKAAEEQAIVASKGDNSKGSSKQQQGTLSKLDGVATPTTSSKKDKITVITPDTKVSEEFQRTPSNSAPIDTSTSTVDPVLVSDDFNDEIATIGAELDDLFNV